MVMDGGVPAAGLLAMLITISGPPATRATLSRTAVTAPVAAGTVRRWRRRTQRSAPAVSSSHAQPAATTASSTVHSPSPKPNGSTASGVGPMTSPTVRVTM